MKTNRWMLFGVWWGISALGLTTALPAAPIEPAADLAFLRELTRDVVEASRVRPGAKVGRSPTNTCSITLIMPGGRGGYPAFWIRDFAMSLESGFISPEEMLNHLRLVARCQNGRTTRKLKHGLVVPPFAIPDHINFDGNAVFFPGTYASGDDQGTGAYGILPPVDDHYEFVHIAWCLYRATGRTGFLQESINGMSLLDRLTAAFEAPTTDGETGLVVTDDARRAVGFGFCDAIYLTGRMLFPSLLRYRAAGQLAELFQSLGNAERAREYRRLQQQIVEHLVPTFGDPARLQGWLMGATGAGRQPDVWGTAYALHLGALKGEAAERAAVTLSDAVRRKTIVCEGAVRHVPTDLDASPTSAWEKTAGVAVNTYQNGAYWHTPTGWLIEAVRRSEPELGSQLFADYIEHLRRKDYRQGTGRGAPWECFGPKDYAQNGVYMTSVTLPFAVLSAEAAQRSVPVLDSPFRAVDLSVGEAASVKLADGSSAEVKLLDLRETRDLLRNAVRKAEVTVEVNGQKLVLTSACYHLPDTVGGVQVDCPITRGLVQRASNPWALDKDVRLRLWPAGAPWIQPGTFRYPLRQRWFASDTQMANEPVFVNGDEAPGKTNVYYHWGLDAGGAEGLTEVIAATDGVVVSSGEARLMSEKLPELVTPRYDVVYLRDGRGWYYRYSHLHTIDETMRPGTHVHMGQRIGLLGKEGGSGGWSHLHFDVVAMQPSGRHGMVEAYAFYWQAYHSERQTKLQAVARPHQFVAVGETVALDGTQSWSALGPSGIRAFEWTFTDGTKSTNATVERRYERPGTYNEILRVTDAAGRSDYDFAVVQVMNPAQPRQLQPAIHASYWPTEDLKPGDEVTFKVRTFQIRPTEGRERWNFGDGSPPVEVQSDGNARTLAKDGYAITTHRYARPGRYLVSVQRTNDRGETATGRLQVLVGGK